MAEVITPAAPAAPSTPSAPAPAAPASSTPAAPTPVSTPAPAATPISNPSGELSIQDKLRDGWSKVKNVGLEEPSETPAAAEVPAVETPAEVPAGEVTKTPEQLAEEAAAAGETTEEKPAGETAAATETPAEIPELDDGTSLGPQEFAKAIEADPATKKFFDENPEIKGQVFAPGRGKPRDTPDCP
jgi:hypothetical protein